MVGYWTQFAKRANPNLEDTPNWPRFDTTGERFQSLVPPTPMTATGFAAEHQCAFWAQFLR